MILNITFLFIFIFGTEKTIISSVYKLKINTIICDNSVLKSLFPTLYDFNKQISLKGFLVHLENIIKKTTNHFFIFNVITKVKSKSQFLEEKINSINSFLHIFFIKFPKSYDRIILYTHIEILFFQFFFDSFKFIINNHTKNHIKTEVYKQMKVYLYCILKKIRTRINNLVAKCKRNKNCESLYIITLKESLSLLKHALLNIEIKLQANLVVTKHYKTYFDNYRRELKLDQYVFHKDYQISLIDNKTDYAYKNLIFLKEALITKISMYSEVVIIEIEILIRKIHDLLEKILKADSFIFDFKYIILIHHYYNYVLKIVTLKNHSFLSCSVSIDKINIGSDLYKLNSIFMTLKQQKMQISKFTQNMVHDYCCLIKYDSRFKHISAMQKIFLDYINIDIIYDIFLNNLNLKNFNAHENDETSKKFISLIKVVKINVCLSNLFDNHFVFFETRCILILRLYQVYLLIKKEFRELSRNIVIKLIQSHINKLYTILTNVKVLNFGNLSKIKFLEVLIEKNKKNIVLISSEKTSIKQNNSNKNIQMPGLDEYIFETDLYNLVIDIFHTEDFH
ncbi:hypothetical protein NUSPORA_01743 [Nucleospora cyclopteri]